MSYFVVEDCGGICTFHEAVRLAASKRKRTVCGVRVSEINTPLHPWLQTQLSVVDRLAGHRTWLQYKLRPFAVDFWAAGFPCQPFSRSGNQLGEGDHRVAVVAAQVDVVFGTLKPKTAVLVC